VRKVTVIVGVEDDAVIPASLLSEIQMAFGGVRDVRLEFVVVRQAPGSAFDMASGDTDFIATFDACDSYSPKDVAKVVAPLLEGRADLVLGDRGLSGASARGRAANSVLTWLFNRLFRLKVGDSQPALRAFRCSAPGLPSSVLRVVTVPISYRSRRQVVPA
jgi:hypothetical protein